MLADTKSYPAEYEHLSDMCLYTLVIGVAELRSVTDIAPKSPFLQGGKGGGGGGAYLSRITPIYIKKYPIIIRSEEIRGRGTRKKGKKLVS